MATIVRVIPIENGCCCDGVNCEAICIYCEEGTPEEVTSFCNGCEEPFPEGYEELCAEACEAIAHCDECDCDDPPPGGCACVLRFPLYTGSPFANYAAAAAAIANPLVVQEGFAFLQSDGVMVHTVNSFSAAHDDTSANVLWNVSNYTSGFSGYMSVWFSVALGTDPLELVLARETNRQDCDGASLRLYDESLTLIEETGVTGGDPCSDSFSGSASITPPAPGCYLVEVRTVMMRENDGDPTVTQTAFILSSDTIVFNPAVALWNDSGTTRQLEARPRMQLPPGDPTSWYEDLAAAEDAMDNVSNCLGAIFLNSPFTVDTFTATGGATLDLNAEQTAFGSPGTYSFELAMLGSVNPVGGDTVTIDFALTNVAASWSNYQVGCTVVDIEDDLILGDVSFNTDTGSFNFVAPYTGRFEVFVSAKSDVPSTDGSAPTITADFEISSSGTATFNPPQARYFVDLDCPARLECS